MKELIYSFQSEWIKTKNSFIVWLTISGALFIPVLILISRLVQHSNTAMMNSTPRIWMKLFTKHWQFMSTLILPTGIILASSIITQIEFRNNTWKQVYTSPQKLSTIFWAKYMLVFFALFQFFLIFNLGIYLSAVLPALFFSDVSYPLGPFPWQDFLKGNITYFIYALPILSLQYLLSLNIRNFIIPIGIGMALLMASLLGVGFQFAYIHPYIYGPMKFFLADSKIDPNIPVIGWALSYFIFFSLANYAIFLSKNQLRKSKYFKLKNLLIALILILVLGISFGIYSLSKSSSPNSKEHSAQEIEEKIKQFEENLGAFKVEGVKEWSLEERMKFYKVNGLSVALVKNYKIEWAKAYGYADYDLQLPVTEETVFEPGSISKAINAYALMNLVQEGKVNLFDDINNYLTSWKFPYDEKSKNQTISLANLLSHTGGLNTHGFEGYDFGDSLPTIPQILDGEFPANSSAVRSLFEPNLKMEYSGGGVLISQLILMDVTKQDYDKYLEEKVFIPLEMKHSFFTQPIPEHKQAHAACGYDSEGKALATKYPILVEQAAGGIWTTASDLCKFIIEIQLSLLGKSNKILSKQNTELMLTPYLNESTSMGFFINESRGAKYFCHDANNRGFSGTFCGSLENGNGLAILINSENSAFLNEVRNTLMDLYAWEGFPQRETKSLIEQKGIDLDKYLGFYEAKAEAREVEITKENETYYYWSNGEKRKMYFISDFEFIHMEQPSTKRFFFKEDSKVAGFTISYQDKHLTFTKRD